MGIGRGPSVIVVGGGLAGLAAASALAARGVAVTLLESRPRLGGRASSFIDRETGTQIDNCQHVSLGCGTNFSHFCGTLGLSDLFLRERRLYFVAPDGTVNEFAASRLPAPFHLLPAFRRLSYLSAADRRCLARGLRALARRKPSAEPQPFSQWLHDQQQTPAAIERFWHVVLVSALSESLDRVDTAYARKVFVDGFLAHRHGWEVLIPTVPLDELYGSRMTSRLTGNGVSLRLQTGVSTVEVNDDRVTAVVLRSGARLEAEHVIVAVPHHRVLSLLPESLQTHPRLAGVAELESAPISSVHLWFDRPITPLPHAVFIERLSQWMFNRSALQPELDEADGRYYYQVVISASRHLSDRAQHETIAEVVAEFCEVWPATAEAKLLHARLVTEHAAVFSVTPGSDALRPPQQSPVPNLQLAGDWTRTGWPATMEGAVRSGYLAAENVLAHLGRPETLLRPDLPVAVLSKLVLGL